MKFISSKKNCDQTTEHLILAIFNCQKGLGNTRETLFFFIYLFFSGTIFSPSPPLCYHYEQIAVKLKMCTSGTFIQEQVKFNNWSRQFSDVSITLK